MLWHILGSADFNMLIYVIFQEVGLTLLSCVPKNMQIPEKGPAKKVSPPFPPGKMHKYGKCGRRMHESLQR